MVENVSPSNEVQPVIDLWLDEAMITVKSASECSKTGNFKTQIP